jgi:hypothetical protein
LGLSAQVSQFQLKFPRWFVVGDLFQVTRLGLPLTSLVQTRFVPERTGDAERVDAG